MITITETAIAKVKEISESEGIGHTNIRLKVVGGGCAGMTHDMCFDEIISELDETFIQDGVTIVIDSMSIHYLDGMTLDYMTTTYGAGFKFLNPNVKASCGCGSSVSF